MTEAKKLSFAELVARGLLFDIDAAAKMTGYCKQHLRRLCVQKKISHKRRGQAFLFTRQDIEDMFVTVVAEKKA